MAAESSLSADVTLERPKPIRVFLKWLLVCSVSAAPSFFWGTIIHEIELVAILGMFAGIIVFIVGYTFLELTPYIQRLMQDNAIRRTAKIGYGTRIAISVIFPIGLYLDLVVGMLSLGITSTILPNSIVVGQENIEPTAELFLGTMSTTIVQGVLINMILGVYMLIVFAIVRAIHSRRQRIDFQSKQF